MIRRRINYILVLACALLFQITNDNYMAHLLLAMAILLPILSLLLSLPGMLCCRLLLTAFPSTQRRGEEAVWQLSPNNRVGLPLARLVIRLEVTSLMTGERERRKLSLFGVSQRRPIEFSADTGHCGLLECRITKARVWDYLGLVSLPVKIPSSVQLLVEPVPIAPGSFHIPECQGNYLDTEYAGRRGNGEDYDLREYRPGDPLRRIHWKLSSKWDKLIVREPSKNAIPLSLLTFDHFGSIVEMDHVLDRLAGFSRAMLALQRPHAILWLDPSDGEPCRCVIEDERDLLDCLSVILSQPCPVSGPSILDKPELFAAKFGPVFHIHVTAGEEAAHDG